jgi:N-acetylmuramoyl-L-alanine amidase
MRLLLLTAATLLSLTGSAAAQEELSRVTGVRFWTLGDTTRVVVETTGEFTFRYDRVSNPDRVYFDIIGTHFDQHGVHNVPVGDRLIQQIRVAQTQPGTTRVVFDLQPPAWVEWTASELTNPNRLIVELRAAAAPPPAAVAPAPDAEKGNAPEAVLPAAGKAVGTTVPQPSAAQPQAKATPPPNTAAKTTPAAASSPGVPKPARLGKNSRSMTRVLGLKIGRIVLDAGHGGHDTGTIGPGGLLEKELVLDVCQRLGSLIAERLGAEVVYTRNDDTFVPLEERTRLANELKADLFLSVHANASRSASASGVETYYLNFTSNQSDLELAARENAASQKTVYELKDLLQKIALQDKIEESAAFAATVQRSLYSASVRANSRTRNRGVKKAPFIVLIGASMPSILAEIGFVSNPRDEALMKRPEFRQKLAEGLYRGIAQYAETLSQFQVAQK